MVKKRPSQPKRKRPAANDLSDSDNEVESQLIPQKTKKAKAVPDDDAFFEYETVTEKEADAKKNTYLQMEKVRQTARGLKRGDTILVNPDNCPDTDNHLLLWKAKIEEVRQKYGTFHFAVRWYYRRADEKGLAIPRGSKFQPSRVCGKRELIESSHQDTISDETVIDKVDIISLTDSPTQDAIGPMDFYCRSYVNISSKKGKASTVKVQAAPCPLCDEHYQPDSSKVQHYCASCAKWYHESCLTKEGCRLDPDLDGSFTAALRRNLPHLQQDSPRKKAKISATPPPAVKRSPAEEKRVLRLIRRMAGQCIVRGGEHGVAGHVRGICAARRIANDLETRQQKLRNVAWEEEIGADLINKVKDSEDEEESTCYRCPKCSSAL